MRSWTRHVITVVPWEMVTAHVKQPFNCVNEDITVTRWFNRGGNADGTAMAITTCSTLYYLNLLAGEKATIIMLDDRMFGEISDPITWPDFTNPSNMTGGMTTRRTNTAFTPFPSPANLFIAVHYDLINHLLLIHNLEDYAGVTRTRLDTVTQAVANLQISNLNNPTSASISAILDNYFSSFRSNIHQLSLDTDTKIRTLEEKLLVSIGSTISGCDAKIRELEKRLKDYIKKEKEASEEIPLLAARLVNLETFVNQGAIISVNLVLMVGGAVIALTQGLMSIGTIGGTTN